MQKKEHFAAAEKRRRAMKKYLLLTGAALIGLSGSAYAAINCAVPPTCDELGYAYTADQCEDQAMLKCPSDITKVFCRTPKSLYIPVTCTVGAILYDDLKCYDNIPSDKTAIGIVSDASKKQAIALNDIKLKWSNKTTDITALSNCTSSNYTTCNINGKDNTKKIVSALETGSDYAAGYCYNKTDGGVAKGTWFLPSASELHPINDNKFILSSSLKAAGRQELSRDDYYWSSNENASNSALIVEMDGGYTTGIDKTSSRYVRCIIAY